MHIPEETTAEHRSGLPARHAERSQPLLHNCRLSGLIQRLLQDGRFEYSIPSRAIYSEVLFDWYRPGASAQSQAPPYTFALGGSRQT